MAQRDYSTPRRKFQHLMKEKRAQIEILLRLKVPKKANCVGGGNRAFDAV